MPANNSPFNLSGKIAVVTGAGGVLGKIFCKTLADNGCVVAAIDKKEMFNGDFATFLAHSHLSDSIVPFPCDITSPTQVKETVSRISLQLGQVNVLVNNAATKTDSLMNFYAPFEEYSLETWREVMAVNIDGMFLMAQSVGLEMLKSDKPSSVIQVSSIYGMLGPHHEIYDNSSYQDVAINSPAVYSASKAAVLGLSKYLATYWGKRNIRVNTLVPGGISSGQNSDFVDAYSSLVPMGRMGRAGELEATLLLLASDSSSYITGQNFVVDGGFSVW